MYWCGMGLLSIIFNLLSALGCRRSFCGPRGLVGASSSAVAAADPLHHSLLASGEREPGCRMRPIVLAVLPRLVAV